MFPVAPGANGQPPSPPTEASSLVTPELTAAYALAVQAWIFRSFELGPQTSPEKVS